MLSHFQSTAKHNSEISAVIASNHSSKPNVEHDIYIEALLAEKHLYFLQLFTLLALTPTCAVTVDYKIYNREPLL